MPNTIKINGNIPFNIWFSEAGLRIFSTCSNWPYCPLENWANYVNENDYVFVFDWNYVSDLDGAYWYNLIKDGPINNFIFFSNTKVVHEKRLSMKLQSHLLSNNIFTNDTLFNVTNDKLWAREYDAIYVARAATVKRIQLAKDVNNLALVINRWYNSKHVRFDQSYTQLDAKYLNERRLTPYEINSLYNESSCGLSLSAKEGACFVVTEYLLSGLPVVCTRISNGQLDLGGRELWLNQDNSIYVDDNSASVREGVNELKERNLKPSDVRETALEILNSQRRYVINEIIAPIFDRHNIQRDPEELFYSDCWKTKFPYRHKLSAEEEPMDVMQAISILSA